MNHCYIPKEYHSTLDLKQTEKAIKQLKDFFEQTLATTMSLTRVSAPLFVNPHSGLNDDLDGTEQAVQFTAPFIEQKLEIVHSLAKWKRTALANYQFKKNTGLYTDMNAIRREEALDNTHSLYVDQWDWELIITQNQRNEEFLKETVKKIYTVFLKTQKYIQDMYPEINQPQLPNEITFLQSEELLQLFPDAKNAEEREYAATKKYGAIFIQGIGHTLSDSKPHGKRSPDYDDWHLNGDIIFWHPLIDQPLELSSMGIRVNHETLKNQLEISQQTEKLNCNYHQEIIAQKLPLTIGGGIGQSRLCMFFLNKAHIGEVQSSVWDNHTKLICKKHNIQLL